jgi:xanthine dehydrogenase molybdopterin-binding subunit B
VSAWRALGTNPNHLRFSGGAETPTYQFVNQKVVSHYTEEIVRAVYMRSVGGIQNVFAIESMMDIGGARTRPPHLGQAYTTTIVDVEVNRQTGVIRVRRAYVGFDAGMIVNPDGLKNQIEGGTIMGISRALKEEVTFSGRSITSSDWRCYPCYVLPRRPTRSRSPRWTTTIPP